MMISGRGSVVLRPVLAVVALALTASAGLAQTGRIDVTVEYLAGNNIYIDAGRERGILDGDTILAYSVDGGPLLGALRVISASADRAVLTFVGDPFPVTRGNSLSLAFGSLPAQGPVAAVGGEPAPPALGASGYGPRLTGRLTVDMNLLSSQVTFPGSDLESADRLFAMPALGLRATLARLPGGLTFNTNMRLAYRYSSDKLIEPEPSARIYEAAISKTFGSAVHIQAGRFYNPFERFSGYWDGALARFGSRNLGAGVAAGFEPERADEGISTQLPKYSAFVDYRCRAGNLAYAGDVSVHQVRPRNDLLEHTYFGWSQRFSVRRFRVSSDLQVDRDPVDGGWVISELFLNTSIPLGERLILGGRYVRRRPYLIWAGDQPFAEQREQAGAGLTYNGFGGFVGVDVTANRWEDGERSLTYGSSLAIPRTALWDLGVSASASYWSRDGTDALVLSPGINRSFGLVDSRLGYQLYRSGNPAGTIETHAVDLQIGLPLTRRTYASLGGQLRIGDALQSQNLRATIWTNF